MTIELGDMTVTQINPSNSIHQGVTVYFNNQKDVRTEIHGIRYGKMFNHEIGHEEMLEIFKEAVKYLEKDNGIQSPDKITNRCNLIEDKEEV